MHGNPNYHQGPPIGFNNQMPQNQNYPQGPQVGFNGQMPQNPNQMHMPQDPNLDNGEGDYDRMIQNMFTSRC